MGLGSATKLSYPTYTLCGSAGFGISYLGFGALFRRSEKLSLGSDSYVENSDSYCVSFFFVCDFGGFESSLTTFNAARLFGVFFRDVDT